MPADDRVTSFPSKAILDLAASSHAVMQAEAASRAAREHWRHLLFSLPKAHAAHDLAAWEAEEAAARHERLKADLRLAELQRAPARRYRISVELAQELTARLEAVRAALRQATGAD